MYLQDLLREPREILVLTVIPRLISELVQSQSYLF